MFDEVGDVDDICGGLGLVDVGEDATQMGEDIRVLQEGMVLDAF